MKNNKIRIGVVGLGYLGSFHLQKYRVLKNVSLTAVVDSSAKQLERFTDDDFLRCKNFKAILDDVDAVSIVTPTTTHFKIAKFFLENRKHVLLEKPMSETTAQANILNKLAKKNKVILQVGHLEQFNPAIIKLKKELSNPQFIEVHRLCKFNPRANDVDVVLDLMIHDIDIVLSLVNKNIKNISMSGKKIITNLIDIANVRIEFDKKIVANLTASRISMKNERKMRVFSDNTYYSIDFMSNELKKLKKIRGNAFSSKEYKFNKVDTLNEEIKNFINSCNNKCKPMTTGLDAERALKVAKRITKGL